MVSTFAQRWILAALCILFAGCTVCDNVQRTTCTEPAAFSWKKDKRRSMALYSQWADEAWQDEIESCPVLIGRADYGLGFRDGFVDFTYAGGTGEPPPIPPRTLWNVAFRSDDGHRRTMDWYDGYRHGARVSRDGGYRSMATIRSSLFGLPRSNEIPAATLLPDVVGYPNDQWPGAEPLPTPELQPQPADRPNETHQPPAQSADDDADATDRADKAPYEKPTLPPVPRNLPPTVPRVSQPRESDEPPTDEPPLELDGARAPATDRNPAQDIEPVPLSIPPTAPDTIQPENLPASGAAPESQPTTSVRFLGASAIAGALPRSQPAPPPSVRRAPQSHNNPSPHPGQVSAVRLAVAMSEPKPLTTPEPSTSSIRLHRGWNVLRGPVSSQPSRAARPIRR